MIKLSRHDLANHVIDLEIPNKHAKNIAIKALLCLNIYQGWSVAGTYIVPFQSMNDIKSIYYYWLYDFGGNRQFDAEINPMEPFYDGQIVDLADYISK